MTRRTGPALSAFFLLILGASVISCTGQKKQAQAEKPMAPVKAALAVQKDVPVEISGIGSVEAYSTVTVRSQVGGEIQSINFKEGQEVRAGQVLFIIDPRPFEAALKQAEAALARDTAQMQYAKADAARYKELVDKGYVARSQYDQTRANADALEATVKADRANVENARLQLGYTRITSPINGRAGALLITGGNIIKANDDKLVVIYQIRPVYVNFPVPEQDLPEVKRHMAQGRLRLLAYPSGQKDNPSEGVLTFIDSAVDAATGTVRLRGEFQNADGRLWPGQSAGTVLRLALRKGAVVVPSQAVQTGQAGQYVFVVKADKTVEVRQVVAGVAHAGETVVEKGVSPGETVVTDGQLQLASGARVEIKEGTGAKEGQSAGTQTQNR